MAEVFERKNTISFSIVCLHHQSHSPAGFRVIKTIFIDKTLNFTEQSAFKHSFGCGSSALPILPGLPAKNFIRSEIRGSWLWSYSVKEGVEFIRSHSYITIH